MSDEITLQDIYDLTLAGREEDRKALASIKAKLDRLASDAEANHGAVWAEITDIKLRLDRIERKKQSLNGHGK